MTIQKMKDSLSKDIFGLTKNEANAKGICIQCKEEALSKCYSDAGRREYYISGMCEKCFDELTGGL